MKNSKEVVKLVIEKYNPDNFPIGNPEWNESEKMWFVPILSEDKKETISTIGIDEKGNSHKV